MAINRGKQFEEKFRLDFEETVSPTLLMRLPDQVSKYAGYSSNLCDFIGFKSPRLFLIECKTTKANTLPFSNITQYDRLLPYKDAEYIYAGVVVWWTKLDTVAWVSIKTLEQMKKDAKKSINIKMIEEKVYDIVVIPSKKKRVFLDSDYSILLNI